VPTSSISQAASTFDVFFVPFDEEARQALIEEYAFFHPATIPAGTYKGLEEDFQGLNVGSMHLITSASQDEELIYQITKTMWENRAEIAEQHPAGKAINPNNVARNTGVEYHPGSVRFYTEAGIWPGSEKAAESGETPSAEASGSDDPSEQSDEETSVEPAAAGT
jgi:TRAP transporter TAXI family solute receptor